MALITTRSGCKVGWAYYSTEAEAQACAKREAAAREQMLREGYDFGYLWPGTITHLPAHPEHGECWQVVTT
jgi:hypothetical protein